MHSRMIYFIIDVLVSLSRQCSLGMHSAEDALGNCYTSHIIYQCDVHNRGHNGLLVEYNLVSLHCSWVCGHTASSLQVLTHLPPTLTSRASITSHEVHTPQIISIILSGTLHKHITSHKYWPTSTPCLVLQYPMKWVNFPSLAWHNRQYHMKWGNVPPLVLYCSGRSGIVGWWLSSLWTNLWHYTLVQSQTKVCDTMCVSLASQPQL